MQNLRVIHINENKKDVEIDEVVKVVVLVYSRSTIKEKIENDMH